MTNNQNNTHANAQNTASICLCLDQPSICLCQDKTQKQQRPQLSIQLTDLAASFSY
jgi:hypothetical protein